MATIFLDICLSDIPKELIKKVESNGKCYLYAKLVERKEMDKYGNTHFISCEPRKEERKENVNYYIGSGKLYVPKDVQVQVSHNDIENAPVAEEGDFPF
ncbi:MAG: hypothetical protein MJZ98_00455 [Paludibacteraceae bacterium]|nr:hypothetical protein [Paludibacteraceae bacterium]